MCSDTRQERRAPDLQKDRYHEPVSRRVKDRTRYIEIAIPGPWLRTYCYRWNLPMSRIESGQRLVVPFAGRKRVGYYLAPIDPPSGITIKNVNNVLDDFTYFPDELVSLCRWMAQYYLANPADCLAAALPPELKGTHKPQLIWADALPEGVTAEVRSQFRADRPLSAKLVNRLRGDRPGLLRDLIKRQILLEDIHSARPERRQKLKGYRVTDVEQFRQFVCTLRRSPDPFDGIRSTRELHDNGWTDYIIRKLLKAGVLAPEYYAASDRIAESVDARKEIDTILPTGEQQQVIDILIESLDEGFQPFLLHGITGSGKTLVYCRVAQALLDRGKSCLVLTPEIALAGTTLAYFRALFGDAVTVIHSAMTDRERWESFAGIRSGRYRVAIGPRSALFAPLPKIGMIIVDEEHDGSYKQDDPSPRFHGRDCAIMRARINDIPVLLGSASPSVESYYHARTGKYRLLELRKRPTGASLPTVQLVDMRTERLRGHTPYLSWPMKREVENQLANGRQVILYLNRRGYSPQMTCGRCGETSACPNCKVKLTYHKVGLKLSCHYCGYVQSLPERCGKCNSSDFITGGAGTQKIEEHLPQLFQKARVVRLDSDSAAGRTRGHQILTNFLNEKTNLLLGTQMVTKGLDIPGVSLVGVLSADAGMDMPDFRASEKTFARLIQVAGRSGRADHPGKVIVQTFDPENDLITDAARHDYKSFYDREIEKRKAVGYPPFVRLVRFVLSSPNEPNLQEAMSHFRQLLEQRIQSASLTVSLLGPAQCPIYYLRRRYRKHIIAKTNQLVRLSQMLANWSLSESNFGLARTVRVVIDIDPDEMM